MRLKEIWKGVHGWEGIYQISNHGRLKSFKGDPFSGRVLSNTNKTGDYLRCVLCFQERTTSISLHRLVAIHFIENPSDKPTVNHKDLNKQNNYFENLEWATYKENNEHAAKIKPQMLTGMINYNKNIRPRTVKQFDLEGKFITSFKTAKIAGIETGVCARNILQVANKTEYKVGKTRKQAGGFIWKFAS